MGFILGDYDNIIKRMGSQMKSNSGKPTNKLITTISTWSKNMFGVKIRKADNTSGTYKNELSLKLNV